MHRLLTLFLISIFSFNCSHFLPSKRSDPPSVRPTPVLSNPEEAEDYPELTDRNRLMGNLSPERSCYDVSHYDLNLDIDLDSNTIAGYNIITALAVNDFSTLQIDLGNEMNIEKIEYNGTELNYTRKEDAVFLEFPPMDEGSEFSFTVYYHGTPRVAPRPPWDDGFVWETDKAGRPFVAVTSEGLGASHWWPCKDHISDEPNSMAINITVPSELWCVANGRLVGTVEKSNGRTEYRWFVNNPINNYNVSVNIGHYIAIQDTIHSLGQVRDATYYVLDYNEDLAREHFKEARTVIRVLEYYFGPYPWWEDGYKLVQTPYLGMEHQSAVAYGNDFRIYDKSKSRSLYGFIDYITLHETAHEWWGNSITACDPAEVWIHEGFGTYSEALYIEYLFGYDLSIDYLIQKRKYIGNKKAIVGPRNQNYWGFSDAYTKGAWIIHTLRNVINNDELFFKTLKGFAVDNAKSIVCTEDVRDYFSEKTGIDLISFFNQYLFNRKVPTLEYAQEDSQFYYRWIDVIDGFDMPVNLFVNKVETRLIPTTQTQILDIPKYATVEIKDWEYLIIKRENNELIPSGITSSE
ncbi:MAG: M1 family metallopeptidase [Candidatus Marinimicrobia bacterium]|nr:M1 family metallopeptidase [Candidatus Neomarinimicrobiota bacterium]